MRFKIATVIFVLCVMSPGYYEINAKENPFDTTSSFHSASYSHGITSSLVNSVFADRECHPDFYYQLSFFNNDETGNFNHLTGVNFWGFSFNYLRFNSVLNDSGSDYVNSNANVFNISKGIFFDNTIGIGAEYSFSRSSVSEYDKLSLWNFGFLLRPWRYISLGITLMNVAGEINGIKLSQKERYSLSVRPFTDRITLSGDIIRTGDGTVDNEYRFSIAGRLPYDITVNFASDLKFNLSFGITMPLYFYSSKGTTMLLNYEMINMRDGVPLYHNAGIALSNMQYKSALTLKDENYLFIKLNKKINENSEMDFFTGKKIVFFDIISSIKKSKSDNSIKGIIIQIDKASLGFAQIQELRKEMLDFRTSGKKIYSIMTTAGNKEYYLATASDKIYFTPNTLFYFTGLKAQVYFFKGLLDKVGIKFEPIKRGKYKSFSEPFTRTGMSEAFKENLVSLLTDTNKQYVNDVARSRKISIKKINDLFQKGALTPETAKKDGFIDSVKYKKEAFEDIEEGLSIVRLPVYFKERSRSYTWAARSAIAILYVQGSIVRGRAGTRAMGASIGDEDYSSELEKAFKSSYVKAVVIRVNSGGGSAAASDYMWKCLIDLKEKYNKPVVFSFGNVAASGGYYIAATGDKIFSSSGTVTGSIGVVSGKISAAELYKKLGINKEIIKMSRFADILSEERNLVKEEKDLLQKGVDFIYDRFTGKVMSARNISSKKISKLAEGRIFTGKQALKNGLIDKMGGLMAAVEYAAEISKIEKNYRIIELPQTLSFVNNLFSDPDVLLLREKMQHLIKGLQVMNYKDEKHLYLYPYKIIIE